MTAIEWILAGTMKYYKLHSLTRKQRWTAILRAAAMAILIPPDWSSLEILLKRYQSHGRLAARMVRKYRGPP